MIKNLPDTLTLLFAALCFILPNWKMQTQDTIRTVHVAMRQYYFEMLTAVLHRAQDSAKVANIQEGQMANIRRLEQMGKLLVAGPFLDNSNRKGIIIIDTAGREEVEKLLATDPAISSMKLT